MIRCLLKLTDVLSLCCFPVKNQQHLIVEEEEERRSRRAKKAEKKDGRYLLVKS